MEIRPQRKSTIVILVAIVSLSIAIFVFIKINEHSSILSKIRANYEDVEVKKSTFFDYKAWKVTISSGEKTILLRIIRDVPIESLLNITKRLESEITAVDKKHSYFNPYEGRNIEYSVPDEFKYTREETSKEGLPEKYYIVYGNAIFSYFVFSEDQIIFKGIASVFACKNDVYKIDIFSKVTSFNKEELLNELSNFYCS